MQAACRNWEGRLLMDPQEECHPALCPRHLRGDEQVLHKWEHRPIWNPRFNSSHYERLLPVFAFEPSTSWRKQPTGTMILGRQTSLVLDFWPLWL